MAQQQRLGKLATTINNDNGLTKVRYHQTDVVCFDDKYIWLDTGGWYTNTTKTRMNQASNQFGLGFHVYQEDGQWFVEKANKEVVTFGSNHQTILSR